MTSGTWPEDWPERVRGRDCPMCAELENGDHAHTTVTRLSHSEVALEPRSRLPGYCIVIWRHGHVAEPMELEPDAAAGYWGNVSQVGRAIQHVFQPVKLNFLTLGNWVPHLHTHVLPRYRDDPAPGGPIAWADIFATDPAPTDVLERQAEDLRRSLGH